MKYALADTGVWYGIFDSRDQRYTEAQSKIEFFDFFRIVIPWPTVYETLRTRFVRNHFALQRFEIFLKTRHIVYLDDDIYRNEALYRIVIAKRQTPQYDRLSASSDY